MLFRSVYKNLSYLSPQAHFRIPLSVPIYFINLAINSEQAKNVVFAEFKSRIMNCGPKLKKIIGPFTESSSRYVFPDNIIAQSGHSRSTAWHGYNTIQGILDEGAWFIDNQQRSIAEECYDALKGSCKTRFKNNYKLIVITSPRFVEDFVMKKFNFVAQKGRLMHFKDDATGISNHE